MGARIRKLSNESDTIQLFYEDKRSSRFKNFWNCHSCFILKSLIALVIVTIIAGLVFNYCTNDINDKMKNYTALKFSSNRVNSAATSNEESGKTIKGKVSDSASIESSTKNITNQTTMDNITKNTTTILPIQTTDLTKATSQPSTNTSAHYGKEQTISNSTQLSETASNNSRSGLDKKTAPTGEVISIVTPISMAANIPARPPNGTLDTKVADNDAKGITAGLNETRLPQAADNNSTTVINSKVIPNNQTASTGTPTTQAVNVTTKSANGTIGLPENVTSHTSKPQQLLQSPEDSKPTSTPGKITVHTGETKGITVASNTPESSKTSASKSTKELNPKLIPTNQTVSIEASATQAVNVTTKSANGTIGLPENVTSHASKPQQLLQTPEVSKPTSTPGKTTVHTGGTKGITVASNTPESSKTSASKATKEPNPKLIPTNQTVSIEASATQAVNVTTKSANGTIGLPENVTSHASKPQQLLQTPELSKPTNIPDKKTAPTGETKSTKTPTT